MADKNLKFTIDADDKASAKFDKVGDTATSSFKKVSTQLDILKEDTLAAGLAADTLGQKLGPEISGRANMDAVVGELKKLGLTAEEVTANADQLAAQLKQLDSANVGGGLGQSLGTARGEAEKLSDSARGAHSALANMVGNTAQDIAGLGGNVGSLGVGIGQMAEYASDAALASEGMGSALKSMATVAGPIAALAITTATLSKIFDANAKSAKQQADAVKASEDAYKSGGNAVENYADSLRKTEEVTVRFGNASVASLGSVGSFLSKLPGAGSGILRVAQDLGLFGKNVEDISGLLSQAGINVDQWSKAVAGGALGSAQLAAALHDTSLSASDQKKVIEGLGNAQADFIQGKHNAAEIEKVFGDGVNRSSDSLAEHEAKMDAATAAAEGFSKIQTEAADQLDRVNQKLHDQADALTAQADAAKSAADSQIAAHDALVSFGEALDAQTASEQAAAQAVAQHGANSEEAAAASRDLADANNSTRDAAIRLANATVQHAQDQAAANGATMSAVDALDMQNASLASTASQAKGPAKAAIEAYIQSVNNIPDETMTEINAAIDRGDIATAESLLQQASRTRQTDINVQQIGAASAGAAIDSAARDRHTTIFVNSVGGTSSMSLPNLRAAGGPVEKGKPYVVGDKFGVNSPSAEVFIPDQDGTIYPGPPSSLNGTTNGGGGPSASGGTGAMNVNITINAGLGTDARALEAAVVGALNQHVRNNGPATIRKMLGVSPVGIVTP